MGGGIPMAGGTANVATGGLGVNTNGFGGGLGVGSVFWRRPVQLPACIWSGIRILTQGRHEECRNGGGRV